MNILLASTSPYRDNFTGANKINRLIVELLAAKGHHCAVLALQKPLAALPVAEGSPQGASTQAQIEVTALNGVQIHAADIAHPGQLPALRTTLQDLIRDTSPDVVLISSEDWGQFLLEAAVTAAPGRVVYLAHTPIALPFGPDSIMPNPAGTSLMQKTAAVIALSHFLADYIFQWSGIKAHTIYPPAYGDGPFPFHTASDGYVTLVNPCTVKGISIFLELARRLPDVQFVAVLTWGTTEADQRAMEALPNITLLQPTDDIDTFLSGTSVMLVPSLWNEAFGLIVVDALLRGIPVLASNIGGLPEAKLGTNFLLPVQPITQYELNQGLTLAREVPDQDIQPWLEALTSLLQDQELHRREAQLARNAAHAFLNSLGIEQYEQIFAEVVAKAPAKQSPGDDSRKAEARVRDLSSDRRALLELLRKEKREAQRRQDTIPVYERVDGDAPLSLAQQRLWVVEQLTPGTALYTIPFVARLHGAFDVAALRQTLDALVARHEPLRTVFRTRAGEPRQHVLPPAPVPLARVDLTALPIATRAATAETLVAAAVQQPFDLTTGPLFRAALLREAPSAHRLVLTVHHLVCDGWSWGLFIREFAALYHQFAGGPPAALPPLPIQYADFAAWQRQRLHGAALEQQLAYWRTQLADAPRLLELPTDFPRPATPALAGALVTAQIPAVLAAQLRDLSQQHGASLYMTLLATWAALLARRSQQDDLVIGTPVAGRTRAELTPLIGFFVNTVALRLRDLRQLSGAALLAQARTVVLDAFAQQDVPFEQVVEAVAPTRVLSHAPLVQVVFALQNEPLQEHHAGTFVLEPEAVGTATAKFDLTLTAVELRDGSLSLTAEYRTDLFRAETIDRLLRQYAVLLAGLVAAPEQPIVTLPLLPDHERTLLLQTWNATTQPYPLRSVPALVAQHATQQPDAIALRAGTTTRTYADLVAQANQLAHRLRTDGVRRGTRVGVYLERDAALVTTLLGVLTAGAAYVPLDVTYPPERIALMLADAAVTLVVTTSALADRLPADVQCLYLDTVDLSAEPTTPPAVTLDPDDLAYVIYTSGSTGRPKGVAVPHRAIVRLVFGNDYTHFDDQRTFLLLAPISFDASTFELWGALLHGARCVLYPESKPDISELRRIIRDEGVTTLWLTASLFNLIVDEAVDILASVKEVVTGGEALSPSHIRRAQHVLPDTQLVNGYGPTETTTFACCYRIPRPFNPEDQSIPIGNPIGNTTAYVVDKQMQIVPIGVAGELYVGGDGLAWGYLQRPDLTAERFVPDPFSQKPGARLYRTGDLVRWRAEGQLEYLGRIDQQVKLRGFRIELGEIEQALYRHAAVRDAVVIVRTDRPGEPRLVAYVVENKESTTFPPSPAAAGEGGKGDEDLAATLRDRLQRMLPAYMIPSAFVVLDALPLTPNGKLDQAALPTPAVESEETAQGQVPINAIEQALADIWSQVLGVEQINRDDNFFALGGDSILAIQAIARANQSGFTLSTRMLFQYQTVAELAEAAQDGTSGQPVVAIQTPVSGNVPLTPIIAWFDELKLAEPHHFNQALLLESSEPLDPLALTQALGALIRQHDALRLRFRPSAEGDPELHIDEELDAPPVVVLDGNAAARAEQIQAIQASLRLEHGPIVRLAIIRYEDDRPDALLFAVHHLAVDGLSWRILLEDLELAYRQIRRGESPQLPPKTTDLISWGRAIQAHATSDEVHTELSYWQSIAALPVSPLPTDGSGKENYVNSTETISISLNSTATEALLSRLPAAYASHTDELLITALAWALQQWSGNPTLALALESHGRATLPGVDVSRTVGWFTSLYPVVLDLQASSLPAAATSIGEQLRAVPPLGLSFGLARYLGDPETRTKLAALRPPEISFNYLGQFGRGAASASIFRPSAEDAGLAQSPRNQRPFAIDVVAVVQGDHLDVHWIFGKQLHRRETMTALAEGFVAACHELIARCPEQAARPVVIEQKRENAVSTPARQKSHDYGLLLPLNPRGALPPFFCVHPSGGTVFCYRSLAQQLGADQPFYGIQAPGFEAGEQPFADLEQMATRYIDEMRRIAPEGPYYIGGWSFGGIVAAEMARQLQASGETVALLAIIDVDPDLSAYQRAQARRMIDLSAQIAHADDLSPASIQRLRLGEQVDALFDERNSGGETIDRERFLTILRVFSAHAQARINYQPQPYQGRAVIFRARNQSILDAAKYAPRSLPLRRIAHNVRPRSPEPSMGWQRLITGTIESFDVPGNHMTLLEDPFVTVLADRLRDVLQRIREVEANPTPGA